MCMRSATDLYTSDGGTTRIGNGRDGSSQLRFGLQSRQTINQLLAKDETLLSAIPQHNLRYRYRHPESQRQSPSLPMCAIHVDDRHGG